MNCGFSTAGYRMFTTELSTTHYPPWAIDYRLRAIDHRRLTMIESAVELSTMHYRQPDLDVQRHNIYAVFHNFRVDVRFLSTIDDRQSMTDNQQLTTDARQSKIEDLQSTTDNKLPTIDDHQSTTERQLTTDTRRPKIYDRQSTIDDLPSTIDD